MKSLCERLNMLRSLVSLGLVVGGCASTGIVGDPRDSEGGESETSGESSDQTPPETREDCRIIEEQREDSAPAAVSTDVDFSKATTSGNFMADGRVQE